VTNAERDERIIAIDGKVDDLLERIHKIELGIAERSGAFAVLKKLGLVMVGVAASVAGAVIISAI
jgi:hypothetical protein